MINGKKVKNNDKKKVDDVTFSTGPRLTMVHKSNPDFAINKSDLIIYLGHFKDAIGYKIKRPNLQTVMEVLFYWSIFFTSTFSGIGFISGSIVRYALLAIASIVTYAKVSDLFSKDKSKYKESNQEKMADIIENSCKQLKDK